MADVYVTVHSYIFMCPGVDRLKKTIAFLSENYVLQYDGIE